MNNYHVPLGNGETTGNSGSTAQLEYNRYLLYVPGTLGGSSTVPTSYGYLDTLSRFP